jgi:hypothetical protein
MFGGGRGWNEILGVRWISFWLVLGLPDIGDVAQIGPDTTEPIDGDELYALVGNAFVLDGVGGEESFDLCSFIWEADDEDFLVSPLDVPCYII